MSDNNIILAANSNSTQVQQNLIHKIISCEKVTDLALEHRELCHGVYAVLNGGAQIKDIEPLLFRLLEQSDDIASLLNQKKSFEEMGYSVSSVSMNG
ncbi:MULTISPECIES: hypothetical protein [Pseudoalteromonas]|uniref:hypothetical protein n=1 Tax=Pseudoalteromonas TaxID=53246 RepID=UPI001B36B4DF|nr:MULTISPECIES: hypothetical protein [Pseudoalteromonas]MBQ4839858.1 hypothetical protein [Pseudoalteromonas luteoviolacea]MDK1286406.1 hypothetical protein [Pseudoalteromonas sp. B95]